MLRGILNAEFVLCDLSSRNPNVLYELGIRQAFNKPAVLIKDEKTDRIFDIQGLRYTEYDSTLRVDSVTEAISQIAKSIIETRDAGQNDVNSLIQLLRIAPAAMPKPKQLNDETKLILNAINELTVRIATLEERSRSREIESQLRDSQADSAKRLIEKLWLRNTPDAEDEIALLESVLRHAAKKNGESTHNVKSKKKDSDDKSPTNY